MADGIPMSDLNLIDIFGYLIPGSLLLAGLAVPIEFDLVLLELPTIAGLTLVGMFAFVVGMVVSRVEGQAWFGRVRGGVRRLLHVAGIHWPRDRLYQPEHAFPADLYEAARRPPEEVEADADPVVDEIGLLAGNPTNVSSDFFDYEVWKLCRERFSLPDDLSRAEYHTLWLGVLSYLETTPHTRAFRMQALYTFSRNMLVVAEVVSIYYAFLVGIKGLDRILDFAFETGFVFLAPVRGLPILVGLLLVAVVSTNVFARSSASFLSQWHLYSKIEFYMDQKLNQ